MVEHHAEAVEERPKLDLSVEEIAIREAEKKSLLAGIAIPTAEARAAVPRARRGRSREALTGDYEPPVVAVQEEAQATPRVVPIKTFFAERGFQDAMSKITADPQELATLMQDAKATQAEAEAADEMAESAKAASINARVRLNEYMREHGLA